MHTVKETSTQAIQFHSRAFQLAKLRPPRSSAKANTQCLRARVLVASSKHYWWTAKRPSPHRAQSKPVIRCRRLSPLRIVSNIETSDVTMALDEGNVKELAATPPPSSDRVPVTNSNRQGIVDPLTALLFSADAAGEDLSPEACRHTLPIFDGHHRYDLKLRFKRMDKVTAEKGYAGPVVVCSVSYEPIAGHRANIPLIKYLSEGREMEIALAPIAGTHLLAPFRLSVVSTLANLMIEANRFETIMAPAPAGTPPNVAHPSDISPTRRDGGDERCVEVRSGVVVCQKVPK